MAVTVAQMPEQPSDLMKGVLGISADETEEKDDRRASEKTGEPGDEAVEDSESVDLRARRVLKLRGRGGAARR